MTRSFHADTLPDIQSSFAGNTFITTYTHNPNLPRASHALFLLRRIASLVKPLMALHNLHVHTLSELPFTDRPNLLGLNYNAGQQICLRLRPAKDPSSFLPEEDILSTMLHELTHNTFGPHDEKFYNLNMKYQDELDGMMIKGWDGDGFYSTGQRLGGRRIPMVEIRRRAVDAAEQRRALTRGSGGTLGGVPGYDWGRERETKEEKRRRLVEAVERRGKAEKGCGSSGIGGRRVQEEVSKEMGKQEVTKADVDDEEWLKDVLETMRIIEEQEKVVKEGGGSDDEVLFVGEKKMGADSKPEAPPASGVTLAGQGQWVCSSCTLINDDPFLQCGCCGEQKPPTPTASTSTSARPRPPPRPATSVPRVPHTSRLLSLDQQPKRRSTSASDGSKKILRSTSSASSTRSSKPVEWKCHDCGLFNSHDFWMCRRCHAIKDHS